MLNKLKFNNMVISNKKGIQQSRIQTINKLVHKIRKLKTLLEKRPEDTKCKERVRKSTETMEQLKKFKRVDIVKNILLLEKPPAAVITNGLSTPEEMAVALLAMNKIMVGLIKRFKSDLKLADAENSTWRDELKINSKRRQKIERTEEKKRKRVALKEQKAIARKRQEWLEHNCQEGEIQEDTKESKCNISTVSGWMVEEIEEPVVNKFVKTEKTVATKISAQLKKPQEDENKKIRRQSPTRKLKIEHKPQLEGIFDENTPSIHQEVNSRRRLASDEKERPNSRKRLASYESAEESTKETHVVDPFFVTETGENYLSTAVASRVQGQDDNNDSENQRDLHMIKLNGSKQHTNFREKNQPQHQSDRYPQKQNNWNANKYPQKTNKWNDNKYPQKEINWKNTNERGQNIKERLPNSPNKNPEQKLHPSWAAKQKLKPVITGFQGKKIKFGDDDNIQMPKSKTPNMKTDQPDYNSKSDNLHPSWAAKQKQKPVITAFQGKKISFENDE